MVKIHLDSKNYKAKPSGGKELKALTERSCKTISELTPEQLAIESAKGRTAVYGVMSSFDKANSNLMYQEVIALDFDNKKEDLFSLTIDEALEDSFIKNNASFLYTTFSHSNDVDKFRIVFILDRKLTNNEQVRALYLKLLEMFPSADQGIKDSSRFFFGGRSYTEINFNNVLTVSEVVKDLPEDTPIKERTEAFKEVKKTKSTTKNNKVVSITDNQTADGSIPTYQLIRVDKKETDEKVASAKQLANDAEVKRRWKQYGFDAQTTASALSDIKKIDMRELLGLPSTGNFHDIFTTDNNPSANIQKVKDGSTYLYFRASSDPNKQFTGDVIKVVQKLRGCNFMTALHYIIDMMGITFGQSEELKRIHEKIEIFKATLNSDDLKESYPNMYHIFGKYGYASDIYRLLTILTESVVEKDGKLQVLNQFSLRELSKRMYYTPDKVYKIDKLINLLSLTDFVKKLQNNEIDEELLHKLEEYRDKKGNPYRKNLVSIEEYGDDFLEDGERKCGELRQFKFTIKESLTREWVLRHLGKEKADEMFPQDTKRTISKQNQKIYDLCVQFAVEEIQNKGFVTEQDVIRKISRTKKIKISKAEFKWKQLRSELCEAYGLEITPLNKDLKKEFQVSAKYGTQRPNILKFVS